eukprot:TRINITY_DN94610_c0_g1_i1.p1 TRINITY_DN94610_c0_g1~~TRINITY_DN94610_c0_g1_i1.p1  ORF type:complete len:373 (-),score=14.50 TRINITY_DN94610_c0_g1_i1:90-1208(-)
MWPLVLLVCTSLVLGLHQDEFTDTIARRYRDSQQTPPIPNPAPCHGRSKNSEHLIYEVYPWSWTNYSLGSAVCLVDYSVGCVVQVVSSVAPSILPGTPLASTVNSSSGDLFWLVIGENKTQGEDLLATTNVYKENDWAMLPYSRTAMQPGIPSNMAYNPLDGKLYQEYISRAGGEWLFGTYDVQTQSVGPILGRISRQPRNVINLGLAALDYHRMQYYSVFRGSRNNTNYVFQVDLRTHKTHGPLGMNPEAFMGDVMYDAKRRRIVATYSPPDRKKGQCNVIHFGSISMDSPEQQPQSITVMPQHIGCHFGLFEAMSAIDEEHDRLVIYGINTTSNRMAWTWLDLGTNQWGQGAQDWGSSYTTLWARPPKQH